MLKSSVDWRILNLSERIRDCGGKVIVIGIWKSWYVGQKMAALLNTIGKTAVSPNPIDLMHGELWIIRPEDLFVIISRSGETEEIIELLRHAKEADSPIREIGIVGILWNTDSSLGRYCEISVDMPYGRELDEHGTLPTVSTVVTMAICDAIVTYVLSKNPPTKERLHFYHKRWDSGKKLSASEHPN